MENNNFVSWFEIPVQNIIRAKAFYEAILGESLQILDLGDVKMALFPQRGVTGSLIQNLWYTPSHQGPLIYLNCNPDLSKVEKRVDDSGGKVLIPKRQISEEHGYMAVIQDTEGNRVALHSIN